jgi:hypothetical protein
MAADVSVGKQMSSDLKRSSGDALNSVEVW